MKEDGKEWSKPSKFSSDGSTQSTTVNPGGNGIMDQIVEKMNVLEMVIAAEIANTFDVESVAHWIATKCLSTTVSFLNQLFTCIELIYKKLFSFSGFTTEKAWSLTTQVLDRILADLFAPKDNMVQSLMTRNTPATCAQVMLAVFRTHDIMAVYVAHKFENHPSVSTEYVKYMKRVIDQLVAKVRDLEKAQKK